MTVLAIAAVAVAAMLAWRPLRNAIWRAAERNIADRLPLGSDGSIRGAQPIYHGGHARAALLLHGFGDTPQSLEPLASRLARAGWTVSVPLLPGHGRTLAQFSASRASEWLRGARDAYNELSGQHQTVVVCGQSMGACLALELAATLPIKALALLAPYISMPRRPRAVGAAWPFFQAVYPVVKTRDGRSVHDPEAEASSLAFGYATPRLLSELSRLVRRSQRDLDAVHSPTLIVHSREDNRVPAHDVVLAAGRIEHPVKALHWVSGCGHVITVDYCKDSVAALVIDWFERCTSLSRAASVAR